MSVSWKDGIVHQEKDYGMFIYAFPVPIMGVKWSKVRSLSRGQLFATLWTRAYQAPPSTGFSRQDYWSGLPFPSPGDLPDPGIQAASPALAGRSLTTDALGKPKDSR